MTTLTPEQRRLVSQAGDGPVRLEDPETHQSFVLLRAEVYERVRPLVEARSGPAEPDDAFRIPEGILKSQEAFFRDLPAMLRDRKLRGKWVAYHRDERVKVGKTQNEVVQECVRRGLPSEEFDVFVIRPQSPEPEEIDMPFSCFDS